MLGMECKGIPFLGSYCGVVREWIAAEEVGGAVVGNPAPV